MPVRVLVIQRRICRELPSLPTPTFLTLLSAVLLALLAPLPAESQRSAEEAEGTPSAVVIAGSMQAEAGCAGDWDPACLATGLAYDAADEIWQGTFLLPAGSYEYLAALNGSWDESYGQGGVLGGANIPLALGSAATVKFYYSDLTHWVTDDVGSIIATVPGSFQSELGCSGDWQPDCLRSWLQDLDGDGGYRLTLHGLAAGSYECKVAISESWDENYGLGGVAGGPVIPFAQTYADYQLDFAYDSVTHILSVKSSLFADGFESANPAAWSASVP
jgi:hypothetical protein